MRIKVRCLEDFNPYTVLEDAELSAQRMFLYVFPRFLNTKPRTLRITIQDTEHALCRSIDVHKLLRHILGADELSAAQETKSASTYLRAYTAALGLDGALPEDDLVLLSAQMFVSLWGTQMRGGDPDLRYELVRDVWILEAFAAPSPSVAQAIILKSSRSRASISASP
ncbi:hypothetical protein DFH11DRAFT_1732745 [Phellopilus nigrolimitatus]|nr:hypothetical protein DFH11DRAFT_1732745 [Phellopilus nigrolimitatus]